MPGVAEAAATVDSPGPLYEKLKPGPGRSTEEVTEHQRARLRAAMLELVAERGYWAVTVRDLAQRASVSSRAFYKHYADKEECFLRTLELIARRVDWRVSAAQEGEADWRSCLRHTIDAYLCELQRDPHAARLLLIDAYVAGPLTLEHVRRAERSLELRLTRCFDLAASGSTLQPLIGRGMAGGVMCVARSRLARGEEDALTELADDLTVWAGSVFETVSGISSTDDPGTIFSQSHGAARTNLQQLSWPASDERGLIVMALAKLAAVEKYHELTVRKVRDSAGASSRKFSTHFTNVADCFEDAIELYGTATISQLTRHGGKGGNESPNGESADPIALLCKGIVDDPALATLCFADIFGPGPGGVQSLDRVIGAVKAAFVESAARPDVSPVVHEASAAAIWAALREEIHAGRRHRLHEVAWQLRALASILPLSMEIENKQPQNLTEHPPGGMLVSRGEPMFPASRNHKVRGIPTR